MGKIMFEYRVRNLNAPHENTWIVGYRSGNEGNDVKLLLKSEYERKLGKKLTEHDIQIRDVNAVPNGFDNQRPNYGWE